MSAIRAANPTGLAACLPRLRTLRGSLGYYKETQRETQDGPPLRGAALGARPHPLAGRPSPARRTDVVKAKQTTLFDLLKQRDPDSQKKIDAIFDEMLDYRRARRGVARHRVGGAQRRREGRVQPTS